MWGICAGKGNRSPASGLVTPKQVWCFQPDDSLSVYRDISPRVLVGKEFTR